MCVGGSQSQWKLLSAMPLKQAVTPWRKELSESQSRTHHCKWNGAGWDGLTVGRRWAEIAIGNCTMEARKWGWICEFKSMRMGKVPGSPFANFSSTLLKSWKNGQQRNTSCSRKALGCFTSLGKRVGGHLLLQFSCLPSSGCPYCCLSSLANDIVEETWHVNY